MEVVLLVILFAVIVAVMISIVPNPDDEPVIKSVTKKSTKRTLTARERLSPEKFARGARENRKLDDWIIAAAKRLAELWAMDFFDAQHLIKEALEMAGMAFPDPNYDWSMCAAREFAEEYANEYGENYGSNS